MPYIPNGFGAGTDNRAQGGNGGYVSYPQPPTPDGFNPTGKQDNGNSWNGQFGPLSFNFNNGTTYFSITNPGRSA